jgi:malonyl-CoA O-methyltransferase
MSIEAATVVDLGAATGSGSRLLARRFRRARVVAVDLSRNMLEETLRKQGWFSRTSTVQASAEALPFVDHSVDVVFANMLLPWLAEPARAFAEISRILRNNGLFLFATLGPDSLDEIRRAWSKIDAGQHVNQFPDMHDIGDAAVRSGLRDPVLDVDRLSVTYENSQSLFRDLTAMGARNSLRGRDRSLGGAARFRSMTDELESLRRGGVLTLDLELVYGHCWGGGQQAVDGEQRISPSQIGRRGR